MDVNRGTEALGYRLHEFEVFGVEVAVIIVARHDDRADCVAIRFDWTRDAALVAHGGDQLLLIFVAPEVDDRVSLHVGEEQRTSDLENGSRNTFARVIRRAIEVIAETRDGGNRGSHAAHAKLSAGRVVHVDYRGSADSVRDAPGRLVQILDRRFPGHRGRAPLPQTLPISPTRTF